MSVLPSEPTLSLPALSEMLGLMLDGVTPVAAERIPGL